MEVLLLSMILYTALGGAQLMRLSAYFLWLFQVKEYRIDRVRSHLRENLRLDKGDALTALATVAMLALLFPATAEFALVSVALILGALAPLCFIFNIGRTVIELRKHSFLHPKPTKKILLIGVVYAFLYALTIGLLLRSSGGVRLVFGPDFLIVLGFLVLILVALAPIYLIIAIAMVTPVTDFQKRRIVRAAAGKMAASKLKTIGITGSFGKTSTKEILRHLLSQRFKVSATEGNNNTLMGVAQTVLGKIPDDCEIFICEMGAYRRGEIKSICDMVRPHGGIITGINEQHLGLFGSLENTKRAKFELVECLSADGFAVVNEAALRLPPPMAFDVKDIRTFTADLAEEVKVMPDGLSFRFEGTLFEVKMLGRHYIGNIIAAIMAAEKLGMNSEEISAALKEFESEDGHLMRRLEGPRGSIFIDDSYSANPDGVAAALDYLVEAYPDKKKIIVFPGIEELGRDSEKIQEKLRAKIAGICDFACLIRSKSIKKEAVVEENACRFIREDDFDRMVKVLEGLIGPDTVVLFESRAAGVVMKKLSANTK